MKNFFHVIFLLIFTAHTSNATENDIHEKSVDSLVEVLIDHYAEEYRDARKQYEVTIKGKSYIASVFTIEGFNSGNNSSSYLSLHAPVYSGDEVSSKLVKLRLIGVKKIGGGFFRDIDYDSLIIKDNEIVIKTKEYQDGDAKCCPSIESEIRFTVSSYNLVEI